MMAFLKRFPGGGFDPIYFLMSMFSRRVLLRATLVASFVVVSITAASAAEQYEWNGVERIVAVGDLHGDYDAFRKIMKSAGLMDDHGRWTGGKTHFVQLGDVPDRGDGTEQIEEDLHKLVKQAERAGGYVHLIMGNHEAMNIIGDYRYVTPGTYKNFVTRKSQKLQDKYFEAYVDSLKKQMPKDKWPSFDDAYRADWNKKFPLGYVEHGLAWSAQGEYGKWALENPTIIEIDGTLFLHGGLSATYAGQDLKTINTTIHDELAANPPVANGAAFQEDSPLWYRGLALGSDADEEPIVSTALSSHEAKRIVVGHTPTLGPIVPRFGGRVILADTGITHYYGENLAYLVIEGDRLFAVYGDKKVELPGPSPEDVLKYFETIRPLMKDPKTVDAYIKRLEPAGEH